MVEIESILLDLAEKNSVEIRNSRLALKSSRPCRAATATIKAEDGLGKAVELILCLYLLNKTTVMDVARRLVWFLAPVFDEQ